jgi:hypothetical protein
MQPTSHRLSRPSGGYTLAEVMIATVMIGMAVGGALSMTSAMIVQEEISWRSTIALNYQENIARLWQLGLGTGNAGDPVTPRVIDIMPLPTNNRMLAEALNSAATATPGATVTPGTLGRLETANTRVTTRNYNTAATPAANVTQLYRPTVR